jgi:hypothetical protein
LRLSQQIRDLRELVLLGDVKWKLKNDEETPTSKLGSGHSQSKKNFHSDISPEVNENFNRVQPIPFHGDMERCPVKLRKTPLSSMTFRFAPLSQRTRIISM